MPFGFGRGGRGGGRGRSMGFRGGKKWGWFGPWGPAGPPETCICPNCGTVATHRSGLPCFRTKCHNCGSFMTRQFFPVQP